MSITETSRPANPQVTLRDRWRGGFEEGAEKLAPEDYRLTRHATSRMYARRLSLKGVHCVLREQLGGKRMGFNDDQHRRLAVTAKKLGGTTPSKSRALDFASGRWDRS